MHRKTSDPQRDVLMHGCRRSRPTLLQNASPESVRESVCVRRNTFDGNIDVLDVQPTPPTEAFGRLMSEASTSPSFRRPMMARAREEPSRQSILLRDAQPLKLLSKPSSARTPAEMRETAELVLHRTLMASNAAVMQQYRVPQQLSSPPLTRPPPVRVFGDGLDGADERMQSMSAPLMRSSLPTIGMSPTIHPASSLRRPSTPLAVSDAFAPPPAPLPSISPTPPSRLARPLVQLPSQPPTLPQPARSSRGCSPVPETVPESSLLEMPMDAAEEDATTWSGGHLSTHTVNCVCTNPLAALETADPLGALERALKAGDLTAETVFGAIFRVRQPVSIPRAVGPRGSAPLRACSRSPPLRASHLPPSLLRSTSTCPTRASRQRSRRWTRVATARSAPRRCVCSLPRCLARTSTRRPLTL